MGTRELVLQQMPYVVAYQVEGYTVKVLRVFMEINDGQTSSERYVAFRSVFLFPAVALYGAT